MSDSLSIALKITGDAKSAVAALEETRRAQLNAFAGGTEAANKAATQWKVAEAEVKRLAQSARESGAGQGELNSKLAEAVAAASKAKSAWADETAALHKRRQALLENKQALEQANAAARAQPPAPSPVDTGRGMLGLVPHEQIRQQIEQVRQAYLGLKASGQLTGAELAQAADRARTRIAALSESMNGARTAGDRMAGAVMLVQKAFIALQAISVGNAVLKTADSMALLQARLKLVEGSTAGANKALDGLNQIAGKASIPVQDAAGAYTKFAQSIYNLGGGQQQALEFTEAIALALRVSGASAQESGSAMLQLGQAMQKGSLNGDEFVSVAENGGKVLDYLAEALGVSRAELKEMSTEGKLGADKLMRIVEVLDKIREDAKSLPQTVGGAVVELGNRWDLWIAKSKTVESVSGSVITALRFLGDNLESIAWTGATGLVLLFASQLGRLRLAIQGVMAALALANFNPVMLALSALVLAVAWVAGSWAAAGDATDAAGAKMETNAKRVQDAARSLGEGVKVAGEKIKEALGEAAKRSETLVTQLQTHGKTATENARSQYETRLRHIENHYRGKQIELDKSHASEDTKTRESAKLVAQAERDKLAAAKEWATGAERKAKEAFDAIARLAKANGGDVGKVERESLQERIGIYTQLESAYRTTVDKLVAEEQRLAGEVRRIEQERYLLKLSTEDRIRALKQGAMSPEQAYADRELQISQKLAAAQLALQKGNFEEAKRLAEQAMSLAERNAGAVSKTVEQNGETVTKTVVSQSTATAKAVENVGKAYELIDKAMAGAATSGRTAMKSVGGEAVQATQDMKGVSTELQRMREVLDSKIALAIEVDKTSIEKVAKEAEQLVKAQNLALSMKAKVEGIEAALEDAKKIADSSKSAELKLKAQLDLDTLRDDVKQLNTIAAAQKLELPAALQTDAAYKSIGVLKEFLSTPTQAKHTPEPELSGYRAAVAELQRPTSSQHTVYVRTVEQHSVGGLVGASARAAANMPRFAVGGHLPGYGGGDRIQALLEAGEFVMRKEAVRRYGLGAMMAINSMRAPLPAYAVGGIVGVPSAPAASAGGGREVLDINLRLPGSAEPVRVSAERGEADRLVQALNQLARVS